MGRSDRILAYDALRVFAIVTVVAIHTLMPYRTYLPETAPVRVFDDLIHYAVPLFVFISGVFLWTRPLPPGPGAFRRFMARRGSAILVPFVAWSALYFTLLVATQGPPSLARSVGLLLIGHTWYHLYFVPMLLTFYAMTPIAAGIAARSPEALLAVCYGIRILAGPAIIAAGTSLAGDLGGAYANHVVTHLPHMALGAWFALRYDSLSPWFRRSWPALLVLGTAILTAASFGVRAELPALARPLVYPLGMAASVLGMALAVRSIEPRLEASRHVQRALPAIAPLAFGVYFVHPLPLLAVFETVPAGRGSLWDQAWFGVAVFVGVTALSFWFSWALARVPVACRLIGINGAGASGSARTRAGGEAGGGSGGAARERRES